MKEPVHVDFSAFSVSVTFFPPGKVLTIREGERREERREKREERKRRRGVEERGEQNMSTATVAKLLEPWAMCPFSCCDLHPCDEISWMILMISQPFLHEVPEGSLYTISLCFSLLEAYTSRARRPSFLSVDDRASVTKFFWCDTLCFNKYKYGWAKYFKQQPSEREEHHDRKLPSRRGRYVAECC